MPATKQAPAPATLPTELEELIEKSIDQMSEKQLREFEKKSGKIMKDSKRRLDAQRAPRKRA